MSALLYALFGLLVLATAVAYTADSVGQLGGMARDVCRDFEPLCNRPEWLVVATAVTGVVLVLARMGRS